MNFAKESIQYAKVCESQQYTSLSGRKSMINCVEENIIYGRISQTSKVFIIFKKCIFDKEHPHLIITAKTLY